MIEGTILSETAAAICFRPEGATEAAAGGEAWPRFRTMEEIIEDLKPSNEVMRDFLRIQYCVWTGPEFNALEEAKLFFPPHDAEETIKRLMEEEKSKVKVRILSRGGDYHCQLASDPKVWDCGKTPEEALGLRKGTILIKNT